ncbi:hypothetical protein GGH13_002779 [Coemansia sp. S155-1]|nr:hypothetical protein GGH13_002779 [Coemansia sp. S155-1]
MGNTQTKDSSEHQAQGLGLHDFVLRHVIGRGAFGKVRVVEHVETRRSYALKYISKALCAERHGEANVIQERAILEEISHAYVANLRFSFQTTHHVFLVLDLMQGGDLRFHMRRQKGLSEGVIRLWIAELASAINYLHTIHGVVHRDIKPENVLMDHEGHLALTDFNAAIRITDKAPMHRGVAGTTSYMAPELISGGEYAGSVDWWSLGVLMYECVFGHRPFRRKSRDDLRRAIIEDDVQFPVTTDSRVSLDCISAIRGLLHKSPERRLGCDGFERLKAHSFFASIDWDALETRDITPLFVPNTSTDNFDKSRVNTGQVSTPPGDNEDTVGSYQSDGILDREYANFNYIEYLTFKAYVEQHGSVTAEAVAEAVDAISTRDGSRAPPPLLQLRLDGRPVVRSKVKTLDAGASTVSLVPSSNSVRRRITTRAVARLKRMNPSMVSLNQSFISGHASERQTSDDTLRHTDIDTTELPGNVPIDAVVWSAMLPSQRLLATRFCAKMTLDRITASLLSVSRTSQPPMNSKLSVTQLPSTKPRSSSCYVSKTQSTRTDCPQPRAVNAVGRQLRHWPSVTNTTKDSSTPRLVPIAAQWKAPRKGKMEAQALVHKTNYPQLNSDPVIVAMAAEIAADGWEVIPKSAAASVVAPWNILSPKQTAFGKVAIL